MSTFRGQYGVGLVLVLFSLAAFFSLQPLIEKDVIGLAYDILFPDDEVSSLEASGLMLQLVCPDNSGNPSSSSLAFPGAEGFGSGTLGGRGGDIYHVTNLNDDGMGSLRYGIEEATGPRTIVFDVSGTIWLDSKLRIFNKQFLTIAGQTSPGGIQIAGYPFNVVHSNNIIIRYLRVRTGDINAWDRPEGVFNNRTIPAKIGKGNKDLIGDAADAIEVYYSENIILDHLSTAWSMDEVLSVTDSNNVTVQSSIIAHALHDSYHHKGPHGLGSLLGGSENITNPADYPGGYSFYRNLYAHNWGRNPSISPTSRGVSILNPYLGLEFINNVIYNWGNFASHGSTAIHAPTPTNFIGNYLIAGPSTSRTDHHAFSPLDRNHVMTNYMYMDDNKYDITLDQTLNGQPLQSIFTFFHNFSTTRYDYPIVQTQSPDEAYAYVLNNVGSNLYLDSYDQSVIEDIDQGTGSIIDSQTEVGDHPTILQQFVVVDRDRDGMSDVWEEHCGLDNRDPTDANLLDQSGYTNLEVYFNHFDNFKAQQTTPDSDVIFEVYDDTYHVLENRQKFVGLRAYSNKNLANPASFSFDGTDDIVEISPLLNTKPYTLSLWFRDDDLSNSGVLYSQTDLTHYFTLSKNSNGNIVFESKQNDTITRESSQTFNDNNWHHLVWVDNNGNAQLYIDGQEISSTESGGSWNYPSNRVVVSYAAIGARKTVSGQVHSWNGLLDEVSLWNLTFSRQDVEEIYNNGCMNNILTHSKQSSLKGWWRMGEGNRQQPSHSGLNWSIPDWSGNQNHGDGVHMFTSGIVYDEAICDYSEHLDYTIVSQPSHGTLYQSSSLDNASYYYVPENNYVGTDSFTFSATDGKTSEQKTITLTVSPTWTAPVGIRVPDFGIEESRMMYEGNVGYYAGPHGPFTHWVNFNTGNDASAGNSGTGTPSAPRRTLPNPIPAGSIVHLEGTSNDDLIFVGEGTASEPIFIVGGTPTNRAVLRGNNKIRSNYIIFEYLDFDRSLKQGHALLVDRDSFDTDGMNHHISVRHSYAHDSPVADGFFAAVNDRQSQDTLRISDIVLYDNEVARLGNPFMYNGTYDACGSCFITNSQRSWVVDNHFHHLEGDAGASSFSFNSQFYDPTSHNANQAPASNISIGRNYFHHTKENAWDVKNSRDTVLSENIMHTFYSSQSSGGEAIVVHDANPIITSDYWHPDQTWIINNEIYDAEWGVSHINQKLRGLSLDYPATYLSFYNQHRNDQVSPTYIIGNKIHDIKHTLRKIEPNDIYFGVAGVRVGQGSQATILNNLFYRNDVAISVDDEFASQATIKNNIFADAGDSLLRLLGESPLFIYSEGNNLDVSHNLYADSSADWVYNNQDYITFSAWQAIDSHSLNANPLLISQYSQIENTSPAIDAGITHSAYQDFLNRYSHSISLDLSGIHRPYESWDIGPFEFEIPPEIKIVEGAYEAERTYLPNGGLFLDSRAQNGEAFGSIVMQTDPYSNSSSKAIHIVSINESGVYQLEGLTLAQHSGQNVIWLQLNNQEFISWNISSSNHFSWNVGPQFTLEKGIHVFTFVPRQSNLLLDQFHLEKISDVSPNEYVLEDVTGALGDDPTYSSTQGQLVDTVSALQSALDTAQPGDIITIKDGTYTNWNFTIPTSVSGTQNNPITIRAQTKSGVRFINDNIIYMYGNYTVLEGFSFFNTSFQTIRLYGSHNKISQNSFYGSGCCHHSNTYGRIIIVRVGAHYNEIDHNFFTKSIGQSIGFSQPSPTDIVSPSPTYNHIHHNTFKDIPRVFSNGGETVMMGLGYTNTSPGYDDNMYTLYEYNKIVRFNGDTEIVSIKSGRNNISHNYIDESYTTQITVRQGDYNLIEKNLITNVTGSIRFSGKHNQFINNIVFLKADGTPITFMYETATDGDIHYLNSENNTIAHNDFIGGKQAVILLKGTGTIQLLPKNNNIFNNIFMFDSAGRVLDKRSPELPIVSSYDFFTENNLHNNILWAKRFPERVNITSNFIQDPLYLDSVTNNVLSNNSPAANLGMRSIVLGDYYGNSRFILPDIGAVEFAHSVLQHCINNSCVDLPNNSSFVYWQNIGWTTTDPATRNIGGLQGPNDTGYWQRLIDDNLQYYIDRGITRIKLHNPFGTLDNEAMQFDQYLHANETLPGLANSFVGPIKSLTDQGIEVIAYIGSPRLDPDMNGLSEEEKWERAWSVVDPLLQAGTSIAFDAAVEGNSSSFTFNFAQALKNRGVRVYVESRSPSAHSHWFDYHQAMLDSRWRFTDPSLPDQHPLVYQNYPANEELKGEILRMLRNGDLSPDLEQRRTQILDIINDNHTIVFPSDAFPIIASILQPGQLATCSDGLDNDGDGYIDLHDRGCVESDQEQYTNYDAGYNYKFANSSNITNWDMFTDVELPEKFTIVYNGPAADDNSLAPLSAGFSHINIPQQIRSLTDKNILPQKNRAAIWNNGAFPNENQPWEINKNPWGNDISLYQSYWQNKLDTFGSFFTGNDLPIDIISTDIENHIRNEDAILNLKNDPNVPLEIRQLSDQEFVAAYKDQMSWLYNQALAYTKQQGYTGKLTSYFDVPIERTWSTIDSYTWEQWQTDRSLLNYITVNTSSPHLEFTDFYNNLDILATSSYYFYDYPEDSSHANWSRAGDYLAYMLFQIEANKAWSTKPLITYQWTHFHPAREFGWQSIPPHMAYASAIFPYFSGADGVWLWETSDNSRWDNLPVYEHYAAGLKELGKYNSLLEQNYSLFIPEPAHTSFVQDNPIWRGIISQNGTQMLVAAHNPYANSTDSTNFDIMYNGGFVKTITVRGLDTHLEVVEITPFVSYECNDGLDNDGDGLVDSNDLGCVNSQDNTETLTEQEYQLSLPDLADEFDTRFYHSYPNAEFTNTIYFMDGYLHGLLTMYEITQNTQYIDIALNAIQIEISEMNDVNDDGYFEFAGEDDHDNNPDTPSIAYCLWQQKGTREWARALRILKTTPALSTYVNQANQLEQVLRRDIINNPIDNCHLRFDDFEWVTHIMSHPMYIVLQFYKIYGDVPYQENNPKTTLQYLQEHAQKIKNGFFINDNKVLWARPACVNLNTTQPGCYSFDARSCTDDLGNTHCHAVDVSHANNFVEVVVELEKENIVFDQNDLTLLSNTLKNNVWTGDKNDIIFRDFTDGQYQGIDSPYEDHRVAGNIAPGWIMLSEYDYELLKLFDDWQITPSIPANRARTKWHNYYPQMFKSTYGINMTIIPQPVSYECNDGIDNDNDGYIDYPTDVSCVSASDNESHFETENIFPIRHKVEEHEEALFNWVPDVTLNVPSFSMDNRPLIRDRGIDQHPTSFLQTIDPQWVIRDFNSTLQTLPVFRRTIHGAGFHQTERIVADTSNTLYQILRVDGTYGNILLSSKNLGRSWDISPLPINGYSFMEFFSGNNVFERGPPPILIKEEHEQWDTYAHRTSLWLVTGNDSETGVKFNSPVKITNNSFGFSIHSGGGPLTATTRDKVYIVWGEVSNFSNQNAGAPTYIGEFDKLTQTMINKKLLGNTTRPQNDVHNTPAICQDGRGYLHVILGSHGNSFQYTRSLSPHTIEAWTPLEDINKSSDWSSAHTYAGALCGLDDVFHIFYRGTIPNSDPLRIGLYHQQRHPLLGWLEPQLLVYPSVGPYSIYYHKPAIDRLGNIYLSYNYLSNEPPYNSSWLTSSIYHWKSLIVSKDNGQQWKLATAKDFSTAYHQYTNSHDLCEDVDRDGVRDYNEATCPQGRDICIMLPSELDINTARGLLPTSSVYNLSLEELNDPRNHSVEISHPNVAEIDFIGSINIIGVNASGCFIVRQIEEAVTIEPGRINISSEDYAQLNNSAILTFYNISYNNPVIYRDGVLCQSPECELLSYNQTSGILRVQVTGFSVYEVGETPPPPQGGSGSTGSGGGGGGGGGARRTAPTCISNWECSYWGECINGYQRRDCVDQNNCGNPSPEERLRCSSSVNAFEEGNSGTPTNENEGSSFSPPLEDNLEEEVPISEESPNKMIGFLTIIVIIAVIILLFGGAGVVFAIHSNVQKELEMERKTKPQMKQLLLRGYSWKQIYVYFFRQGIPATIISKVFSTLKTEHYILHARKLGFNDEQIANKLHLMSVPPKIIHKAFLELEPKK